MASFDDACHPAGAGDIRRSKSPSDYRWNAKLINIVGRPPCQGEKPVYDRTSQGPPPSGEDRHLQAALCRQQGERQPPHCHYHSHRGAYPLWRLELSILVPTRVFDASLKTDSFYWERQYPLRSKTEIATLPLSSTMQTLVSLTDTSNPAKWSMLRFSF
jgi:hypothetical protein